MALSVDLNADLGEGFGPWKMGNDAELLDIVSSANIACGFHAGDPAIMARTVRLCRDKGVGIGAHPGFDDKIGFGRREIAGTEPALLEAMILYQIGALREIAAAEGAGIGHVKLHGALANMAARDANLARLVALALARLPSPPVLLAIAGTHLEREGRAAGLTVAAEVFADRGYGDDGHLLPRAEEGALLTDPHEAAERMVRMVEEGVIVCRSGKCLPVTIDSICVHGDGPAALAIARAVREALETAGIAVRPFAAARPARSPA